MKFSPSCVLFDLDGTLVDTAPDLAHAANLVREDLRMAPLPLEHYRPVASSGARGLLRAALDLTPEHPDFPARKERFLVHYESNLSKGSRLFAGMDQVLATLEARGVRWGVVTNKVRRFTEPLLKDLKLTERCACIIAGDDVLKPKPAPDSILLACARLDINPAEGLYVGDDLRDIVAGKAAGMPSVAAGWGYMGDNPDPASWSPDAIVPTPTGLLTLIGLN
jgi:phosphoglycolate phosphatase